MASRAVSAEVAGEVGRVMANVGDAVAVDEILMFIECMKMDIPVLAPWAGAVRTIHVQEGALVEEGQLLVELET
jgi:biotin carboxyl carrier protein